MALSEPATEEAATAVEAKRATLEKHAAQYTAVCTLLDRVLLKTLAQGTTGVGPQGTLQLSVEVSLYGSVDEIEKLTRAQLQLVQTLSLLKRMA